MIQAETVPDNSDHLSLVPRLLVGTVMLVCRYPTLVLGVSALSVIVCIWAACTRLQYRTQRDELISPDKECQQCWRSYLDEFGDDEDMVVVVRGSPSARARMTAALEDLADKVRRSPSTSTVCSTRWTCATSPTALCCFCQRTKSVRFSRTSSV